MHRFFFNLLRNFWNAIFAIVGLHIPPETEWHYFEAWFRRTLLDGTKDRGPLMRRWRNERWEYRLASESEYLDEVNRNAW